VSSDQSTQVEGDAMESEQTDQQSAPGAGTPQPEEDARRHWYAIHTYSGYENKVKTHLEARVDAMNVRERIFQVVVPTEDEVEIRGGQRRTVTRKIYPGYVLVDMVLDDDTWHVVRSTPGVTGFVGTSSTEPVPLTENELRFILRQKEKGEEVKPKARINFNVGQNVKVIDGPFAEFIGTVSEIDAARNKVTVLVSFFGRETPVTLDFLQVEKV